MAEIEDHKEQFADWHPGPEKPSRWGGALNIAKGFGDRAKEATAGAIAKGKDAVQNFDKDAALNAAREQIQKASVTGKGLVSRGIELAGEMKERTIETFESERFQQLTRTIGEVLTSQEARKVLDGLPFAGGLVKMVEAGKGSTLRQKSLSGFGRLKYGIGGAKDLAIDVAGGETIKMAKIGLALVEAGPDILTKVGGALKEKGI
jgi:hypothetical protein